MPEDFLEIKLDNTKVEKKLLELSQKCENLRPLMKNIAGIFAYSTEENFSKEGRPKWQDLKKSTKKKREKSGHWPGKILQVKGKLAASISTIYDNNSAMIGSNLAYAAIHQAGGETGKNKSVKIDPRPYIKIQPKEQKEILDEVENFLKK